MALTIPAPLQTALDGYERYGIVLITFEFGTGTYGLHTGQGEFTYNGLVYRGGGSLLDVSELEMNADGTVAELTLTLGTQPKIGISADILQTFYDEDWHMRQVTFQLGMLDPLTGLPYGLITLIQGVIYQAPYTKGKEADKIAGRIVSRTQKLSESGDKYRNAATQKLIDPSDTSLVDIGSLNGFITRELKWGQV